MSHMDALASIYCRYYSERFIVNVTHVFYELYSSHSACYVMLCSFLKVNASSVRRCFLISKRKQHTFGTFGQIKLQGKQ